MSLQELRHYFKCARRHQKHCCACWSHQMFVLAALKLTSLFRSDPNLSVTVKCPRRCPEWSDGERCKECEYEHDRAVDFPSRPTSLPHPPRFVCPSISISAFVWLFGWQADRLFWPRAGSSPRADDDIFVPAGLDVLPAFQHLWSLADVSPGTHCTVPKPRN